MNMWGLQKEFIDVLETRFNDFLGSIQEGDIKKEYLLPTIIGELLEEGKVVVDILTSKDAWFGVTYKEDKDAVKASIQALVEAGAYPTELK